MDATTMLSINKLIPSLKKDHPQFTFQESDRFCWSPVEKTIYYNKNNPDNTKDLLHELAHALLGHADYKFDIELVNMECEAWQKVTNLAKVYQISISSDEIETNLDTYREWLHKRSICPSCHANGVQQDATTYRCLICAHKWRVNEARLCALRRYQINR